MLSKQVYHEILVKVGRSSVCARACVRVVHYHSVDLVWVVLCSFKPAILEAKFSISTWNQQTVNCFVRDLKPSDWKSEWELRPDSSEPYCYKMSGAFSSSFSQPQYWLTVSFASLLSNLNMLLLLFLHHFNNPASEVIFFFLKSKKYRFAPKRKAAL